MKRYNLKKISLLFIIMIFTFTLFTGCGKKETADASAFIGEWKLTLLEDEEMGSMTSEDLEELGVGESVFVIKEDNTAILTIAGEEIPSTWKLKDSNSIIFEGLEGEGQTTGILEDGKMVLEDEETRMEFTK